MRVNMGFPGSNFQISLIFPPLCCGIKDFVYKVSSIVINIKQLRDFSSHAILLWKIVVIRFGSAPGYLQSRKASLEYRWVISIYWAISLDLVESLSWACNLLLKDFSFLIWMYSRISTKSISFFGITVNDLDLQLFHRQRSQSVSHQTMKATCTNFTVM